MATLVEEVTTINFVVATIVSYLLVQIRGDRERDICSGKINQIFTLSRIIITKILGLVSAISGLSLV